jgi:predicted RNA binding protein YcfA (HicA-like mRNA interferase family)
MKQRLPRVTAAQTIRALEKAGFIFSRQSGSHRIYKSNDGRRVTVPIHSGRILHPKILQNILRDADLTSEEFERLMK